MRLRQTFSITVALVLAAMLAACSSGSKSTGGGGGGGNPISVALSGQPTSITTNATASVTATVTNDTANAGVTWSCAPSGSCGTFNPTSTGSGTATTYTAPAAVPSGGSVTITATSVTDGTKSASATVTVTAPAGPPLAAGTYVFQLSGTYGTGASSGGTAAASAYFVAGAFSVDSTGAVTGGEQDFVDYNSVAHDAIATGTASTVTTTGDGNVQIVLTTCTGPCPSSPDPNVGVAGVETFNASLTPSSVCATSGGPCQGRLIEFDTAASSSGTIALQDATAAAAGANGNYIFAVQGVNAGDSPLAIGGILSASSGTLSTTNTILDVNSQTTPLGGQTISAGTVGTPDSFGRVTFQFTPTNTTQLHTISLVGYIADSSHIELVEGSDPSGGTTGGIALAQASSGLAVAGNSYVVGLTGSDTTANLQFAGVLTFTGTTTGTVGGTISYNDLFNAQAASNPLTGGAYTDGGNGRITITGITDGTATLPVQNLQLYLDGNGNALSVSLDTVDVLEGQGAQPSSSPTVSGTYTMNATGGDATNQFELDAVGQATVSSSTFSGFADLNWLNTGTTATQSPNLAVTGAFTSTGAGSGNTITGLDVTTATNADAFTYYVIDSTRVLGIEVDSNQQTLVYFEQ